MQIIGQNFPSVDTAAPWFVTLLVCVGWGITAIKQRAEIKKLEAERDKLKAEAIEAAGTTLERKQAARTAHRDACRSVSTASNQLIEVIKAKSDDFSEARDNLCRIITDDVLHSFHNYCEWTKLELTHNSAGMEEFVARVLCPELDRILLWVKICNHDRFVKEHKLNPLKISEQTLYVYSQLCSCMDDDGRKATAAASVNAVIERLLRA